MKGNLLNRNMLACMCLLITYAEAVKMKMSDKQVQSLHHKMRLNKAVGDSFFSRPIEEFPADNNLALTRSFIYSPAAQTKRIVQSDITGKKVNVGAFEVDVLWLYVLGILIIIGVTVGGIICCC